MPGYRYRHRAKWLLGATAFICGLAATPALPCADETPVKVYALIQTGNDYFDPGELPFLAPSNDSRTNMLLFLADARGVHPHLPAGARPRPYDPPYAQDRYAAQTPFDLDTLSAAFSPPRPVTTDASPYIDGSADRCRSNAAGADGYLAALKASNTPAAEQALLTTARAALTTACTSGAKIAPTTAPDPAITSASGKDFAAYLNAATAFYANEFTVARQGFAALSTSPQPWLRDAARYMVARADLNAAQGNAFDQYGQFASSNIDARTVTLAESEFVGYLHDNPSGAYAASARGLLRRVLWLRGNTEKLAEVYGSAFDTSAPKLLNVPMVDLVYEIDNKLLGDAQSGGIKPEDIQDPQLLAALDLMHMRPNGTKPAVLTQAELDAQAPVFAAEPELYTYLRAAYAFYVDAHPAIALNILGPVKATAHMSSVSFSAQVLKGLALESLRRSATARAHWLALIPLSETVLQRPAIELALAENYEKSGDVAAVFAPGSPIHDPTYRETLLTNSASPELLRARATAADAPTHERQLALFVLLFKELTRGRYQAFADDWHLLPDPAPGQPDAYDKLQIGLTEPPALGDFARFGKRPHDGYTCPAIDAVARTLAANPHDEAGLMCVGEFLRLNDYGQFPRQDNAPAKQKQWQKPAQLSTAATQFPGKGISRLDVYKAIINDAKAAPDLRAYALYRGVRCWAPAGYNECDDTTDVPESRRHQWFTELRTRYPATPWAKELKFYW